MMDARTQAMFAEAEFLLKNANARCINLRGELAAAQAEIAALKKPAAKPEKAKK